MTPAGITHTARLPFGITATFRWREGAMQVEWAPAMPRIRSPRAWRRFRAAYEAARRTFMQDVATTIGAAVLVADITGEVEVISPATKH